MLSLLLFVLTLVRSIFPGRYRFCEELSTGGSQPGSSARSVYGFTPLVAACWLS